MPGLHVHRLHSGLWELRSTHRVLGVYERKSAARAARARLLKRGRTRYDAPTPTRKE